VRAPFGIALQGIRDNPRRMNALGFTSSRTASPPTRWPADRGRRRRAVRLVQRLITPGSVGTSWLINILVIAVLGGMKHPIGAFSARIVFVLLQTFAIDVHRPRALQPRDRRRVPRHRAVFPRRPARLWAKLGSALRPNATDRLPTEGDTVKMTNGFRALAGRPRRRRACCGAAWAPGSR
jgi:hypothetical protein